MPIQFYYSKRYQSRLENGALELMEQAIAYCTSHYLSLIHISSHVLKKEKSAGSPFFSGFVFFTCLITAISTQTMEIVDTKNTTTDKSANVFLLSNPMPNAIN